MTAAVSKWTGMILAVSLLAVAGGGAGCRLATFSDDSRRKGIGLYEQGNYTDAAGSFQNAVRQLPTDYRSHYWLGQTYEKLGQDQRAIQSYKSARDTRLETMAGIQDADTTGKIFEGLARTIATSTDRDAEIDILKQRAGSARHGDDLIVLARVFRNAGDPDSAIATYQQAIEKFPREQWYAKEFGLYLKSLGLNDRARQVLSAGAKIKPNDEINQALKGL